MSASPGPASAARSNSVKVAIVYKRYMPLDEQVMRMLETQLTGYGFEVLTDRQLAVGVEWAREIEARIRRADAVIPILSPGAAQSEMIAYEVEVADETAQRANGRPRMLPVRVNYSGPFPEMLFRVLDAVQVFSWRGREDDQRLVSDLVKALQEIPRAMEAPAMPKPLVFRLKTHPSAAPELPGAPVNAPGAPIPARLEPVGGAVPLDSEFYVIRPQDGEFRAAVTRFDSIVLIKGARQMGKTSLLARGLQQARERGAKVALTDFQKLNVSDLESPAHLYLALAETIAEQLQLAKSPRDVWEERRGANVNFERYLRREVLAKLNAPLVWGLDEVDRLFTCTFGSEVFGLFRSWHNERALDPGGPWAGLTLAIAYATEAHLFITDMNQSPFNVGTRLALDDFTADQVADLNRRYRSPLKGAQELERFRQLVGGHPFLVRRALHEMVTQRLDLPALEAQADRDEGIFGDHLRRMLVLLARDPALTEELRDILRGQPCASAESFYRLRSAGLIVGPSPNEVRPRCQLYASYLKRHLL
jgi:AAA-like domain/TIR domain